MNDNLHSAWSQLGQHIHVKKFLSLIEQAQKTSTKLFSHFVTSASCVPDT